MGLQLFFSFLVSASTAILNNVERRFIILCGISGVITAGVYDYLNIYNSAAISSLISCIALSLFSQLLYHLTKMPSIIFTISGIMPIVPGSLLFKTFNSLAENNYTHAINYGSQAILVGFSIAVGLILNETFTSILVNLKRKFLPRKKKDY
ncbi:threonine/serine exporter family protein [Vagococcus vulneris]|uniref:Threonine/Serine exporter ThrE domain-containing protein n=1 Tax=Vagococcus vulneris TaxID=1977869 RepID=A0A430A1L8_9ENTE|nr:threonine/serine exporter family protein [Vagococcus vulneris]RSU00270.1 hypothetical protein CBF37_02940 [Vagococcus vulneris]